MSFPPNCNLKFLQFIRNRKRYNISVRCIKFGNFVKSRWTRHRWPHLRCTSRNIKYVKRELSNATLTSLALVSYDDDFSIFDMAQQDFPRRTYKASQSSSETTATYMKMYCFSNEQSTFWRGCSVIPNRAMRKCWYSMLNLCL